MIKKLFNDGCLGIKLSSAEFMTENRLLETLRDISPLSPRETELLAYNVYYKEQGISLFPESGYRVGWKRGTNMSYLVIVFCPIRGGGEEEL